MHLSLAQRAAPSARPEIAGRRDAGPRKSVLLLLLFGCGHAAPRPSPSYGLVRVDAVEVCLPPGERAYLEALRCPGGGAPAVERQGSVGTRTHLTDPDDPRALLQMDPASPVPPGDPDLHIVDAFRVSCGARESTVFLDMYHCAGPAPRAAPEGFSLEE